MICGSDMPHAHNIFQQKRKNAKIDLNGIKEIYTDSQIFHLKHDTLIIQVGMWMGDFNSKEYPQDLTHCFAVSITRI